MCHSMTPAGRQTDSEAAGGQTRTSCLVDVLAGTEEKRDRERVRGGGGGVERVLGTRKRRKHAAKGFSLIFIMGSDPGK